MRGSQSLARVRAFAVGTAILISLPTLYASTNEAAATFNEKLRAPKDLTLTQLTALAREYFSIVGEQSNLSDALRDPAVHSKWVDLRWQLDRALDNRSLAEGLSEFGITLEVDGGYRVDLARFPQWHPFDARLASLLVPELRESTLEVLKRRGFRDSDVQALRAYLATHPAPLYDADAVNREITDGFARRVQARQSRGLRLDRADTLALLYQRHRNLEEQARVWTLALLDTLDAPRRSTLEAMLMNPRPLMSVAG